MSTLAMSAALEADLLLLGWADQTAFENADFTPTQGTPYQRVNFLLARPDNTENNAYYLQRGIMQVTLCYPLGGGAGAALTRAELIRSTFPRGRSIAADGGIVVNIDRTAEIAPALIDDTEYRLPVSVFFFAHVTA